MIIRYNNSKEEINKLELFKLHTDKSFYKKKRFVGFISSLIIMWISFIVCYYYKVPLIINICTLLLLGYLIYIIMSYLSGMYMEKKAINQIEYNNEEVCINITESQFLVRRSNYEDLYILKNIDVCLIDDISIIIALKNDDYIIVPTNVFEDNVHLDIFIEMLGLEEILD